jgi:aerobic carbon-monoxide dehydrogenase medium subunit
MKPASFAYVRPASIAETVERLGDGADAKIIAGGQSLVPMLNLRMVAADTLLDVSRIAELRASADNGGEVTLGACVTHEQIQSGAVPDPSNGLMPYVASRIAYQAVRNRGTIGGSLALADPAADWLTTSATLGATITFSGPDGAKSCPADDFVIGPYTTRLDAGDVLTGVRIPRLDPDATWGTYKLCRKTGEFAHAMAMVVRQARGARAFLGATNGAPIRLGHVATVLGGLRGWDATHAKPIVDAFEADLREADRSTDDVFAWQSRTCVLRAIKLSFGVQPPISESF